MTLESTLEGAVRCEETLFKIGGMQCSFCVESIRKALGSVDGVEETFVNLSHEEALVRFRPERVCAEDIAELLTELGYTVRDPTKVMTIEEEEREERKHRRTLLSGTVVALISLLLMVMMWTGHRQSWFPQLMLFLSLVMVFWVGHHILRMAIASLRRGILNQHVLMEAGAIGGIIGGLTGLFIQPWPTLDFLGASVFITLYHILSAHVSLMVRARSSRAILRLMELQPDTARRVDETEEVVVPINEIEVGDLVRVRPGERIPVDGLVRDGESTVDRRLVTGEPMPVPVEEGDEVIGGSFNQFGALTIETTRVGEESFLRQVSRSIQEARALKPGIIQLVESVLRYFVPAVLLTALAALLGWIMVPLLWGGEPDYQTALMSSLAVLVMGYPCALGMATPLAMIRGGGLAAERGILMRSGEAFQVFKDVSVIALDKTGTITEGRPDVVSVQPVQGRLEREVLEVAVSIEQLSEHPLARSLVSYAESKGLSSQDTVEDFRTVSGRGVRALAGGEEILVGSPRFLEEEGVPFGADGGIPQEERTLIGVARAGELLGYVTFSDRLKLDSKQTITQMKEMGIEPVMITGDNKVVAGAVAGELGLSRYYAEVTPQDKASLIRQLQAEGGRVAMVGDGINDAPALMQADVGIAFGSGSDIAIESADIVIVNRNLRSVIDAYVIGEKSYRKTRQNVTMAFVFNGLGIPLAALGLLQPVFAMVAMAASVSTILLNSFVGRLLPRSRGTEERVRVTYRVPTIRCGGCVEVLSAALQGQDGVIGLDGDPEEKLLFVEFLSDHTSPEEISNVIRGERHEVSEMEIH